MTNQDPYIPPGRPGPPGTNPPRHQPSPHERSGSTTWIGALILVLALLAGGAYLWATRGGHSDAAGNPPAQTSGQGGTRVNPGADQNVPNPTPPAR